MPAPNINTDQIIPSAWLRTATADLGNGLFGSQRYDEAGSERPDFILNQPGWRNARILLAGENFGCGSSREAAVWALVQFGVGCVLAPSFADIFYENAFRNGLVAGVIDADAFEDLRRAAAAGPASYAVDLASGTITGPDGTRWAVSVPASRARALMRGDDEIAITLAMQPEIDAHFDRSRAATPWLFPESLMERPSR
ncbi:3-isopropylmalate dehydratase small subunit [Alsobacter soli]|uniref:3-isopropylmalate dehydratase n=2 Tax=Alsobacter soli TaxID=2109933 RepID=A0A2T1HYL1_9HYPH|nr:3-isopropylmalate dehydratase small subunit [Alsobacter soli]